MKLEEQEVLKIENQRLKTATQDSEVRAASHERTATHLRNEKYNLDTLIEGLRLEIEKQKLKNVQLISNEVIGRLSCSIFDYQPVYFKQQIMIL